MTDYDEKLDPDTEFEHGVIRTGLELIANTPNGMTLTEWSDFSNGVLNMLAQNASLREQLREMREALEPMVAAFESQREKYAHRYEDPNLGYQFFDKMPDHWPLPDPNFDMGTFRRARALTEKQDG